MNPKISKLQEFAEKELPDDNYLPEIFEVMLIAWKRVVIPDIETNEPRITALWKDKCRDVNCERYSDSGSMFDFIYEEQETDKITGKQICRKDMSVRLYVQGNINSIKRNAPYLVIESKKLNGKNISAYTGQEGMKCFITEKYDPFVSYSAMAGYIIQGNITKVKAELLKKITNSAALATRGNFQPCPFFPEHLPHGTTQHMVRGREITIHHLFLEAGS
jgi:hypothetical protein